MRPRHAVLLTPLESADPVCLLISIIHAPVTPLESALTSPSQLTENTATLSPAETALTQLSPATPLECALTKNMGGGDLSIPIQNRPLATPHSARYSSSFFSHPCALFCAFLHSEKTQLSSFQSFPHSFAKNTGGWGTPFCYHPASLPGRRHELWPKAPGNPRRLRAPFLGRQHQRDLRAPLVYGVFASLALYIQGQLNFSTEQTGTLTGLFGGMVWFLAIFGGAAADKLGFRRALSMAYLILAAAYFLIGSIGASWLAPVRNAVPLGLFVGCILILPALGISLVKPSVVGTTARASKENVRSIGYSIYYTMVNV